MVRWISLGLYFLYIIGVSIKSQRSYAKTVEAILAGRISRRKVYWGQITGMGLPAVLLLLQAAFGVFPFGELGLGLPAFGADTWLIVATSVCYAAYLIYLIYSLFSAYRKAAAGKYPQNLPDRVRALCPATKREKRLWAATAVWTGVTEELLFRGLMLGALGAMLPDVSIWIVLLSSSLLFGAGHLYQGMRQAVGPALLGLLYGVFFIAFGSVLPVITVHALQDLRVLWVVPDSQETAPSPPSDPIPQ
jgi:membrane protease YdiL (CAAX protease family)